ncbi:shikimate kinase [Pseudomonadota bacterium]|nr:shikimate kinase [Pseudomonadota bacterium]
MKKSISLIGMAGAGKSSIGKKLANHLKFDLIDSDQLIEANWNKSLQEILVETGTQEFKKIEEAAILSVELNQTVLATGGSAIFSKKAMNHIKSNSSVIYLEVSFEDIMDRIPDFSNRGFIKRADQTMEDAFNERESIYREFADHIVINNDDLESCFNKILSVI